MIVQRIHHCYADGIALVQVFLSLTDSTPQRSDRRPDPETWTQEQARESSVFPRLMEPATGWFRSCGDLVEKLARRGMSGRAGSAKRRQICPMRPRDWQVNWCSSLTLPADPKTLFKGKLGARKRVAWAEPLPLDEVKSLSKVLGCTVNDLLIAAVTGPCAVTCWPRGRHASLEPRFARRFRSTCRPLEHARELGNHFGLVFLALPVGEANPLERVQRVSERHERIEGKQAGDRCVWIAGGTGNGAIGFAETGP